MDNFVQQVLEDRNIFHYKKYWLNAPAGSIEEQTLAIFSFGTLQDAVSHQLSLTLLMIEKLRKLTIISLAMEHRQIRYSLLLAKCQINDISTLEEYLISLQPIIKCQLDHVGENVVIVACLDGRDVYCNEKPLPKMAQPPMTKEHLLRSLQQWKLKLQKQILE